MMTTATCTGPGQPPRIGRAVRRALPAVAAPDAATSTRLIHLLIVDDDLGAIEQLGRMLKDFAQISFTTSGEDALRLAELYRPDLVLLDVELPGLGGFEVCRQLRASPGLRDLPIVIATHHVDADTEAQALRLGADDFVRKPFSAPVLRARMRRLVDRQRSLERHLEQVDHRQDEAAIARRATAPMLSYIAHEIGNPVNVIKGFAQLMQGEQLSAGQAEKLSHILDAVGRLGGLLAEVTDVARMEAGQFDVALDDVELQALARQACDQAQAATAGLRLTAPPPAPPVRVRADARRLRQCLDNLLSNAVKYGNAGAGIEVEIQAHGANIALAVQDHGCGLSESQLAQLFEPYNRLGRDGGAIPGTGLGLMLTRDLVQAMGGQLLVHSRPGHGSRFEMLLKASPPPANPY